MSLELAQLDAVWPLGASLAAVAARGLYAGRRRAALNEALHELRRPLQVLALVGPSSAEPASSQGAVQMAATALERLEREINGRPPVAVRAPMPVRPLVDAAVGRWKARAGLGGGSLSLRWRAGDAVVDGDRCELAQALDNLIVNAIEHGGTEVVVAASARDDRLLVSVVDSGPAVPPVPRRRDPTSVVGKLSGRRLHGHGLRVVRRVAAAHGGEFHLRRVERRTEAVIELPLAVGAAA